LLVVRFAELLQVPVKRAWEERQRRAGGSKERLDAGWFGSAEGLPCRGGCFQLIFRDGPARFEQRLQFIISQSIEAGYVIEAIRELSSTAVPFEAVNIKQAAEAALSANKDLLEKHAVAVSLQLSADLPAVSGRPKQLEIVFVNLVKNAAEAMRDLPADRRRELHIEGRSDHTHVVLAVVDTGPGVKPEDMGKLFSARYSTKGQGGTGLGLYLSHEIIEGHNGTVEVSSREGSGTTFTIRLPITSKTH